MTGHKSVANAKINRLMRRRLIPSALYHGETFTSAEIEEGANRAGEALMENRRITEAVKKVIEEEVKDPKLARKILTRLERERVIFDPFGTRLEKLMRETFRDSGRGKAQKKP
ncbi:MAG: hypothetical protein KGH94_04195 [Candidatus Micrarchaeota archaeon]|nr:hypothetical protein [Candidatus Micrarchaeota archaeon]